MVLLSLLQGRKMMEDFQSIADATFFGQQSDCRMEDSTDSTWHLATFQRPPLRMDVRKESDVCARVCFFKPETTWYI